GLVVPLLVVATLLMHWRRPAPVRVLAATAPAPPAVSGEVDPIPSIDRLLAELEGTTVRIDGADELDESAVAELERLAEKLEAAAASLGGLGETVAVPHGRAGRRAAASSVAPIAPLSALPASLQSRRPAHPCNEHLSPSPPRSSTLYRRVRAEVRPFRAGLGRARDLREGPERALGLDRLLDRRRLA